MARIPLTDGSGRWFDDQSAISFAESTRWNGNNHISRATGSQWDHETLYHTRSGQWVLHHWSQWQGSLERYDTVAETEAVAWLVNNEYGPDDLEGLPPRVLEAVKAAMDKSEL